MIPYLREIALTVGMYSLFVLATLAVLEFFGCRAPIRDGLVRLCGFLRAKWAMRGVPSLASARARLRGFTSTFSRLHPAHRRAVIEAEKRWGDLDIAAPDLIWPDEPLDDLPPGLRVHAEDIESVEYVLDDEDKAWLNAPLGPYAEPEKSTTPRRPRRKRRPKKEK